MNFSDPQENYFDKKIILKIENLSKDIADIINQSYLIIQRFYEINKKIGIKSKI
jgi:hypothetical protein